MSADRNEALRLADALVKAYPHIYTGLAPSAAALLCQQAERIAELEARVHTCGPTCSKAGCINRRLTTERDQLRAEVERLRVERERWYTSFEHVSRILSGIHALMYPAPFTLSDGRTVVFRPKDPGPHEILQALSDRIRAIPDEVAAIAARTTHKDEG